MQDITLYTRNNKNAEITIPAIRKEFYANKQYTLVAEVAGVREFEIAFNLLTRFKKPQAHEVVNFTRKFKQINFGDILLAIYRIPFYNKNGDRDRKKDTFETKAQVITARGFVTI